MWDATDGLKPVCFKEDILCLVAERLHELLEAARWAPVGGRCGRRGEPPK